MSYVKARQALETKLISLSGLPSEIAWENTNFERQQGVPYLEAQFVPTSRKVVHIGAGPEHRDQGVFRIIIYIPQGIGTALLGDYIEVLKEGFNTNTAITAGDIVVRTDYVEPQRVIEISPWAYQTLNIGWHFYSL